MILEVVDQGRFEKLAVVNGSAGKDIEPLPKQNCAVVSIRNCVTDEIVFDGLGFEWMKVSNPFVDIQTRSY